MKKNGSTKCTNCGCENPENLESCVVCGARLASSATSGNQGKEKTGNATDDSLKGEPRRVEAVGLIFWIIPVVMLILGITINWDLGAAQPLESGIELGMLFCVFYFGVGGSFLLITRIFACNHEASAPWKAGLLGLFQFPCSLFLSIVLIELFNNEPISQLSLESETSLRLGLTAVLYFIANFIGLRSLLRKPLQSTTLPENFEMPDSPKKISRILAFLKINDISNKTFEKVYFYGKYGILLPPLVTLAIAIILPAFQPPEFKNFLWAEVSYEFGLPAQAMKFVDKSLQENNKLAPSLHLKGVLLISKYPSAESASQAIELIGSAVSLFPTDIRYLASLSLAYLQVGLYQEALAMITRAILLAPQEPALWRRKADILLVSKNREEAEKAFRKLLSLTPDDPGALNNLSFTLLELNRNLPEALELAKESVRLQPKHVYNLDTLAWALYKNAFYAESYEIMKEVRANASGSAEIEVHYAIIADKLGILVDPQKTFKNLLSRKEVNLNFELASYVIAALASSTPEGSFLPEKLETPASDSAR